MSGIVVGVAVRWVNQVANFLIGIFSNQRSDHTFVVAVFLVEFDEGSTFFELEFLFGIDVQNQLCLLYTSPSPRD